MTKQKLKKLLPLAPIINKLTNIGATCYLVGGIVRDLFLNQTSSDIDIEVHNLSLDTLQNELGRFSETILVGKQFGVLRMHKYNVDWSLPRTDSIGRKPTVSLDKNLTIDRALERRDITINAIALNLSELVKNFDYSKIIIIDPFGGINDLENKIINAVSPDKFIEDPLRFFRVMQFLARFGFSTSEKMDDIARKMILDRKDKLSPFFIPNERITLELEKMFLKSEFPSQGFSWILKIGRLNEIFPELDLIVQNNNWSSFCQSLDRCSQEFEKIGHSSDTKLIMQLTCIAFWIANKKSKLSFFKSLFFNEKIVRQAINLSEKLLVILRLDDKVQAQLFAKEIEPISIFHFLTLQSCLGLINEEEKSDFISFAEDINILHKSIEPIINGYDILQYMSPGPCIREILVKAYQFQIKNPGLKKEDLLVIIFKSLNL